MSGASPSSFNLTSRRAGEEIHVVLAGDLDMPATFRLEPELERLLGEEDVRRLVLDLADVSFMDSAGLGALLSIRQRAEGLGTEMRLARPSAPVQRILALTGADAVFAG